MSEVEGLCQHLRSGGPAPEDLEVLSDAVERASELASEIGHRLASAPQPAVSSGVVPEDAVRKLTLQWRHNAQGYGRRDQHAAGIWRSCARDLEAALAASPKLEAQANVQSSDFALLGLIADIRAAAGDPQGRLMQDELVAHIAARSKAQPAVDAAMVERHCAASVLGWDGLIPSAKESCRESARRGLTAALSGQPAEAPAVADPNELTRLADEMHQASPAGTDVHWKTLRRFSDRLRTLAQKWAASEPRGTAHASSDDQCNVCKAWPVDGDACQNCGTQRPFGRAPRGGEVRDA